MGVELGQAIVIELPRPDAPGRQMAETDDRQRRLGRHRIQVVALGDPPGKMTGYPDVVIDEPPESARTDVLPAHPQLEGAPAPGALHAVLVEVEHRGAGIERARGA